MSPRTGRPPKVDGAKRIKVQVRMTQERINMLDKCVKQLGTNRTDVIEKGIDLVVKQLDEEKK